MIKLTKRAAKKFVKRPIYTRRFSNRSLENKDLLQYARENGRIYEFSSDSNKIDVPSHLVGAIDFSPRITCVISNAKIVGDRGLILTKENQPVLESVKSSTDYLNRAIKSITFPLFLSLLDITKRSTPDYEIGISMVMHTSREHHYGHWLIEYLPILYHLCKFEKETGVEPKILINKDPPDWMINSFDFFGYDSSQISEFDYEKAKIDELLIPLRGSTGDTADEIQFSPIELQWVRDTITSKVDNNDKNNTSRRIFVSRQGLARSRKVGNFDDVKRVLHKYDFEIVRPEELTIDQQVNKFSNAEIIVGGYGSGLHNIIFAKNTHVIELLQNEYTPYEVNEALSIALGHDYSSVIGEKLQIMNDNFTDTEVKHMPFTVPVEELDDNIQSILMPDST